MTKDAPKPLVVTTSRAADVALMAISITRAQSEAEVAALRERIAQQDDVMRTVRLRCEYILNVCKDAREMRLEAEEILRVIGRTP